MGWFYGFKLHIVINGQGELMAFCLTPGNTGDRKPVPKLFKKLMGLAAGDKGYISKKMAAELAAMGVNFITKTRRNMKPIKRSSFEKFFLAKRAIVEVVTGQLKEICQIEHTRHRKPDNFLVNLMAALAAYTLVYSGVIRPPVPIVSGHPFQFYPASDSGGSGHPCF